MSRWIRLSAPVAAAVVLAGCAAVGPNFQRPAAADAKGYVMTGDSVPPSVALSPDARAAGPWWRHLGSADLDAVMATALRDSPTAAEAVATLDRARAEEAVAAADRKPKIDANAGAVRERINVQAFGFSGFPGFPAVSNPTISLFSIGATVNYGLDIFGLTRRRIEVAGAVASADARRADAAYLALTGNVALQAVKIAGLREEIAVLGDVIADDRESIEIVRAAEAAGGESRTAGLGGQAQLEGDQALAPPVEQELAQARHQLAGLVGQAPATWTAPNFAFSAFTPPAVIPVALPSALVRNRPDILAAEADLHADTARVGVATANLYPNINLVAGLTQEALTPGSIFSFNSTAYDFGAQATAPIFHGGALRAERRAAQAQARASLARYRVTVSNAFVQVADVLTDLAEADKRLATAQARENTARTGVADAQAAYRLGGGPRADIVVARRRLDQARLSRVEAAALRLEDIVALYAATATDWGRPSLH
jgi:NodT family efflux transporter outer membrane factor (OMF) lipoprotein